MGSILPCKRAPVAPVDCEGRPGCRQPTAGARQCSTSWARRCFSSANCSGLKMHGDALRQAAALGDGMGGERGHDDDLEFAQRAGGLERAQHLEAVDARHAQVRDQQIGPRGADLQQRLEAAGHARQVDRQAPGAQVQLEKLAEIRLVLDHQDLEGAARRAAADDALAPLQQLLDRRRQDAAMAARCLPGAQQAGLGPELHGAQRNAEAIGGFARRTDLLTRFHGAPLPASARTAGMTASRDADCNAKLCDRRAGEFR